LPVARGKFGRNLNNRKKENKNLMSLLLTTAEANCLADINNPGFEHDAPEMIPSALRANVLDTFDHLYPGSFGEKWGIDEYTLRNKILSATPEELIELGHAITRFWNEYDQGKYMDHYFPCLC
jgi:hypothetical protein